MDNMVYVTVQGDTFDSIAFEYYTDEKLASVIIEANPEYADTLIFDEEAELSIPVIEEEEETPSTAPPWRK